MCSSEIRPGTMTVITLTYNEEANIAQALDSVAGWADEIHISIPLAPTERWISPAYTAATLRRTIRKLCKATELCAGASPDSQRVDFFLDADEWLPDALKQEIRALIASCPRENGFYVKWRLIWMGRWIRRGYYPSWILRLFRYGKAVARIGRSMNTYRRWPDGSLRNDFMHEDRKGITEWIAKHNRYATEESQELFNTRSAPDYREIDATAAWHAGTAQTLVALQGLEPTAGVDSSIFLFFLSVRPRRRVSGWPRGVCLSFSAGALVSYAHRYQVPGIEEVPCGTGAGAT